jgi:hypothetical protein
MNCLPTSLFEGVQHDKGKKSYLAQQPSSVNMAGVKLWMRATTM